MTLSGGQIAEDLSWMFANITAHADPAGLHPGTYEQVTVVFLEPLMTGGVRVGLPAIWRGRCRFASSASMRCRATCTRCPFGCKRGA
jgi:hypothetical protein